MSYYEEYERRLGHKAGARISSNKRAPTALLTDRSAYISYLEMQLDRVSASCLAVQAFNDRLQQVQDQNTQCEARVNTLSHELKITKEEHARTLETLQSANANLLSRLSSAEALDSTTPPISPNRLESTIHSQIEAEQALFESKLTATVERRFRQYMEEWSIGVAQSDKRVLNLLEKTQTSINTKLSAFKKELLAEVQRDMCQMNKDSQKAFDRTKSTHIHQLQEQVSSLKIMLETHLQSLTTQMADQKQSDTLVLQQVSERVERLSEELDSSANQYSKFSRDLRSRAYLAEQTCTRLADDALRKIDVHRSALMEELKDSGLIAKEEHLQKTNELNAFCEEVRADFQRRERSMSSLMKETQKHVQQIISNLEVDRSKHKNHHKSLTETEIRQIATEVAQSFLVSKHSSNRDNKNHNNGVGEAEDENEVETSEDLLNNRQQSMREKVLARFRRSSPANFNRTEHLTKKADLVVNDELIKPNNNSYCSSPIHRPSLLDGVNTGSNNLQQIVRTIEELEEDLDSIQQPSSFRIQVHNHHKAAEVSPTRVKSRKAAAGSSSSNLQKNITRVLSGRKAAAASETTTTKQQPSKKKKRTTKTASSRTTTAEHAKKPKKISTNFSSSNPWTLRT